MREKILRLVEEERGGWDLNRALSSLIKVAEALARTRRERAAKLGERAGGNYVSRPAYAKKALAKKMKAEGRVSHLDAWARKEDVSSIKSDPDDSVSVLAWGVDILSGPADSARVEGDLLEVFHVHQALVTARGEQGSLVYQVSQIGP